MRVERSSTYQFLHRVLSGLRESFDFEIRTDDCTESNTTVDGAKEASGDIVVLHFRYRMSLLEEEENEEWEGGEEQGAWQFILQAVVGAV